ncbi:MAG: hypothetical protein WC816_07540 [Sphingomonas sp.]
MLAQTAISTAPITQISDAASAYRQCVRDHAFTTAASESVETAIAAALKSCSEAAADYEDAITAEQSFYSASDGSEQTRMRRGMVATMNRNLTSELTVDLRSQQAARQSR